MEKLKITDEPCNKCYKETKHDVLFVKREKGTEKFDQGFSVDWGIAWTLLQCRGCETVSLKRESWNSEDYDEQMSYNITASYFPPRSFREIPSWVNESKIPDEVEGLLRELYIALQSGCRAASAMLMRAVFERVMIRKVGDHGTFSKNLAEFEKLGFIGKKQAGLITAMLEAGHASIHRAFVPELKDLVTLLDILEGTLATIYVHAPQAAAIKRKIPKRRKAPAKTP